MVDIEGDFDCVDSEDMQSLDSDSKTKSFNFPQFNPKTDGDNPVLCLEYTFGTKQEFKNVVATHEIKNGKYIQWRRNDSVRMEARCKHHPECKWKSWLLECKETRLSRLKLTISYILKVAEFRDRVSIELRAQVTLSKAKRAKIKAIALIDGDIKDQYKIMWDYCNEIDRTNPDSTVYMKFIDNEIPMSHRDFKEDIFVLLHSSLEKENKDTWAWFLNHLAVDLNIHEIDWTFMSDKQKGLIEAFNEVLPHVNHRFCVIHLHNNFKRAGFGGITLKKALWAAAKATTTRKFNDCMADILKLDPDAAACLSDKDPSKWSMSHFSSDAKCDTLLNNLCEVFNSMILDTRDKPIVTLLEKLRYLLMAGMLTNRERLRNGIWVMFVLRSRIYYTKIRLQLLNIYQENQITGGMKF
ncbi:uncharacterized protein [Nicotiana tomentosiformis]|uniref:uncharacterized protein n=1 Tax=Nicotiana tomentosiformis TaxID=4098 RepID=UPI00388C8E36